MQILDWEVAWTRHTMIVEGNVMRIIFVLAGGLMALAAACGGDASGNGIKGASDEAQVRRLMEQQLSLLRDENWRDLYATYSARFQAQCSYDTFLGQVRRATQSDFDYGALRHENLKVSVSGDTARTTYITTYKGKDTSAAVDASPDIYTRIDGRWYDDVDAHTKC